MTLDYHMYSYVGLECLIMYYRLSIERQAKNQVFQEEREEGKDISDLLVLLVHTSAKPGKSGIPG